MKIILFGYRLGRPCHKINLFLSLAGLGIQKTAVRRFEIASGETREYQVGEAYVEIDGQGATSLVVFGPEEATTRLGVATLELLCLQADPVTKTLKPLELLLLSRGWDEVCATLRYGTHQMLGQALLIQSTLRRDRIQPLSQIGSYPYLVFSDPFYCVIVRI